GPRNHYGSNSGGNMLSFPMYEDFRDQFVDRGDEPALPRLTQAIASGAHTLWIFSGVFARRAVALNIAIGGHTEDVPRALVSGRVFETLGVGAAIGRLITPEDDQVKDASPGP